MKPVSSDFARSYMQLYFGCDPQPGLQWWLIVRPDARVERPQYVAWYAVEVDGVSVALAGV